MRELQEQKEEQNELVWINRMKPPYTIGRVPFASLCQKGEEWTLEESNGKKERRKYPWREALVSLIDQKYGRVSCSNAAKGKREKERETYTKVARYLYNLFIIESIWEKRKSSDSIQLSLKLDWWERSPTIVHKSRKKQWWWRRGKNNFPSSLIDTIGSSSNGSWMKIKNKHKREWDVHLQKTV